MTRAHDSISRTVALVLGLLVVVTASAAGSSSSSGVRSNGNSFMLVQATPAPPVAGTTPSPGTGIPSSKPVIVNPYHVPLLQDAGSLTFGR